MSKNDMTLTRRALLGAGGVLAASTAVPTASGAAFSLPAGLKQANVSLIAGAMGKVGLDPIKYSMTTELKPLVHDGKTMIGPAVTTKWEAGEIDDAEDVNKYVFDPIDQANAGSVWVIASGTTEIYSMFGDIVAQAAKRNGMLGAVTDSGCRDIVDIEKHGFNVFAKSTVPYGPGPIKPTGANVPVKCGGVQVNPGDLIAADIDGILVIPKDSIDKVSNAIAERINYENDVRSKIEAGATLRDAYPY